MRKISWAFPMMASLSVASAVASGITAAGQVQAATKMVRDESAEWLKIDSGHKTVTLKVIANATDENGGHNFDGYSKGEMQVHVPLGWKVQVTFRNKNATVPHSLMVVPYKQRNFESGFTTAFSGASTPSPTRGITRGITQSFRFLANKSGTFAMVCGVPGHSEFGGMWDKLIVSSSYKTPSVLVTVDNTSSGYGGY
ncbi:MAG: hypothetical protein K6T83_01600 [Alicyclobacillus sp.]|nr:hypothetical protein [Alicyclobacillus sp.]